MKIRSILIAFSPVAFFLALSGNASAQFHPGILHHLALHGHHPGLVAKHNAKHVLHQQALANHAIAHPHHYACGYYQQPPVFVGPEVIRYSNGDFGGTYVSGYNGGFFGTPGVTRVHTGSRGPVRMATGVSNLDSFHFGGGPVSSVPSSAAPRTQKAPAAGWMNMGSPVGGPVGTWYEDASTPGNVFQYTIHADGTYEMAELTKSTSGPMNLVTKIPARVSFSYEDGTMVLNPGGAYEEGPFEVSMSGNALGESRVTLRNAETGKARVWRTAP